MRLDKFTLKSQEALEQAQTIAAQRGNPQVDTQHLLLALLSDEEGICVEILKKLGVEPDRVRNDALQALEQLPQQTGASADRYFSNQLRAVLEAAFKEMEQLKDEYVSVEHLLIALWQSRAARLRARILQHRGVHERQNLHGPDRHPAALSESPIKSPEEKYQALKRFTRDLTEACPQRQARSGHRP